jgi:hypothetical protein
MAMFTPRVSAVGYLPTSHPATGPRLTMRSGDGLMQRRLDRAAIRVAKHQDPSIGTAVRLSKRTAKVA